MFQKIRHQIIQLSSTQVTLLTIWALVMVSIPLVDWSVGGAVMLGPITVGVIITAGVIVALLWGAWGAAIALQVSAFIFILSWAAEAIGSRFGFPFGAYNYTDALQPQIFGVPAQIPLGWLMMLPPAWAVAQAISDQITSRWKFLAFAGLSGLAMTAWDLFLDPMMVAWGIWVWEHPIGFFGIPWINYAGWFFITVVITLIIRPDKLPLAPLLIVYSAIWLLKSAGLGIFWGIHGPAIVGFVIMGLVTFFAWRAFVKEK